MFFHLLKYRLKIFLKPSDEIFWSVAFPFILSTLFFFAFGNFMDKAESFSPIAVAIVKEKGADQSATSFLDEISASGENQLLDAKTVSKDEADTLLSNNDVDGIIFVSSTLSLTIKDNGYNESILNSILDQYLSTAATIKDISEKDPSKIQKALASLTESIQLNKEITLNEHQNTDPMTSYFYALISMSCLFNSFFAFKATTETQANLSTLAARRSITPTHKLTLILSDFFACLIIGFVSMCLLICYLAFVLGVNFGDRLPFVFLTTLIGCIVGITFGIFITSAIKGSTNLKSSILTSVTLILCFLSGLMFEGMMDIVEKHCPIINRINPAALISDAIYSLSIFDSYHRYLMDLGILLLISVILILASYLLTRRERYASL